ncbi:uncharacterized protein LOC131930854 [Physella acuta]|uniref:uncharacterized protein LOC131930854 n=1 Tax=Physella acuta TaxID=109671 RepID=UPI0027DAC1DA|nr:uncharacterized protein LOC131930854 [Physella acuta]
MKSVPALTTITWALCLYFDGNSRSLYAGDKFEYIITAPMVIGLVINLIIVVNLIRIILTKLSSNNSTEAKKIWQVSKSMMILMFLLGPIHLVFAYPMSSDKNAVVSIIYRVYNIIAPHVQAVVCAIYTVTTGKVINLVTSEFFRVNSLVELV